MLKKLLLCSLWIISLSYTSVNAQTIIEQLGGAKTDFVFYSGEFLLDVDQQYIVPKQYVVAVEEGGASQTSINLDFSSKDKARAVIFDKKTARHLRFYLKLYDDKNNLLHEFGGLYGTEKWLPSMQQYFYSIDITDIPILLLNKVGKIDVYFQKHLKGAN